MRTRRPLILGVGVVLTALVGYALAQLVLPQPGGSTRTATASSASTSAARAPLSEASGSAGPTRTVDGIPEGFARSPEGAVAAASNYLDALEQALSAGSARWGEVARALTVAPLTGQALSAEAAAGAIAHKVASAGTPTFIRGWGLGYRVDSYSPGSARVQVWTAGVMVGGAGVVAPEYSTTVCTLRWLDGDWKLAAAQSTPGPTPPVDGSDPAAVSAFASSATRFEPFSDAP